MTTVTATTDMRVLRETFALFDKNDSKRISVNDMGDFLRLMGEDIPAEEISLMLQDVSGGSTDGLNFEQFAKFMMQEDEAEAAAAAAANASPKSGTSSKRSSKRSSTGSKRSSTGSSSSTKKKRRSTKSSRPSSSAASRSSKKSSTTKKTIIPKLKIGSSNHSVLQRKRSKSQMSGTSKLLSFLSPRSSKKSGSARTSSRSGTRSSRSKKTTTSVINRKRSNSSNNADDTLSPADKTLKEMERAFQAFDLDGDGKLSTREVGIMMRRFGLGSQEKSIQNLFDLLKPSDTSSNTVEEIDFHQFLKLTTMV